MSQPLPAALPALKARAAAAGYRVALEEAAETLDKLADEYGRLRDKKLSMPPLTLLAGFLLGILFCVVKGCTTIDTHTPPPRDWPVLKQSVIYTQDAPRICAKYAPLSIACAEVNFIRRTCVIYTSVDWKHVLEHERQHCEGYDHHGESTLRDLWARYKRNGGR